MVSSKHPPLDGSRLKDEIFCLNSVIILVVKLTAWGSKFQAEQ